MKSMLDDIKTKPFYLGMISKHGEYEILYESFKAYPIIFILTIVAA